MCFFLLPLLRGDRLPLWGTGNLRFKQPLRQRRASSPSAFRELGSVNVAERGRGSCLPAAGGAGVWESLSEANASEDGERRRNSLKLFKRFLAPGAAASAHLRLLLAVMQLPPSSKPPWVVPSACRRLYTLALTAAGPRLHPPGRPGRFCVSVSVRTEASWVERRLQRPPSQPGADWAGGVFLFGAVCFSRTSVWLPRGSDFPSQHLISQETVELVATWANSGTLRGGLSLLLADPGSPSEAAHGRSSQTRLALRSVQRSFLAPGCAHFISP